MRDFIKSTILKAATIFERSPLTITNQKGGGGNWVTKADIAIEKFILAQIRLTYPKHAILSEETVPDFNPNNQENIWIVDPLDGTTNATFGLPHYGISIAYVHEKEVRFSSIYDIVQKQLFTAEKGKGVYMADKKRLRIEDHGIAGSLICAGSPYSRENFERIIPHIDLVHKKGGRLIILGSSVIESTYVAQNILSMYFEVGLKPWDVAAAKLIIEEAGGIAESFDGHLDIFNPQTYLCGSKQCVLEFRNKVLKKGN